MSDGRIVVAGEGWYLALNLRGSEVAGRLCRAVAEDSPRPRRHCCRTELPKKRHAPGVPDPGSPGAGNC